MRQPSLDYNILKCALSRLGRPPADLDEVEYAWARNQAQQACAEQQRILASAEGMKVVVPAHEVEEAFAAMAGRYESAAAFEEDMQANHLDRQTMVEAIEVELAVEATIAQVAVRAEEPGASQIDDELAAQGDQFGEQRQGRHILITINDQFPENSREAARQRISRLRDQALNAAADFAALASRHSECPSALQGGQLGPVGRGRLEAELDRVFFSLQEGEVSEVVESPMGFHVLLCEEIRAADPAALRERVRQKLYAQSKKQAVRTWLDALHCSGSC